MTSVQSESTTPPRSAFVSVLAWTFIALAGFTTLIAILQNIMVTLVFPVAEMKDAAAKAKEAPDLPWLASLVLGNVRLFFFGFLVLSSAMLVSAIGLLKRRNWARIAFICLLIFGVLWNIGGMIFAVYFFTSVPITPPTAPPDFASHFDLMSKIMLGFNILIGVGLAVLFAWIVKRLLSPEIRDEFAAV